MALAQLPNLAPLLASAEACSSQGQLAKAVTLYEQIIDNCRQQLNLIEQNNRYYPDTPFEVTPVVNSMLNIILIQADLYESLGDLPRAEAGRAEAARLSEKYLTGGDAAERERQLALGLASQGRFNEALVSFTKARDIFAARGDMLNQSMATANIANMLEWLGDYERALQETGATLQTIAPLTANQSFSMSGSLSSLLGGNLQDLAKLKEIEKSMKLAQISLELEQVQARCNRYLGRYGEAKQQFQRILPRVPEESRPGIEGQFAAIAVESGSFAEGLAILSRLEPQFIGELRPRLGVLLSLRGEALLGLGRPGEALRALDAGIQDVTRYHDLDTLWKLQWRRARALQALKRSLEGLAAYRQSVESINNLRKASLGYRLDSTYLKDKMRVYTAAIDLACESGQPEECCGFMEAVKSHTLTSVLTIPAGQPQPAASQLEAQLDVLTQEINTLEFTIYQNGSTPESEKEKENRLKKSGGPARANPDFRPALAVVIRAGPIRAEQGAGPVERSRAGRSDPVLPAGFGGLRALEGRQMCGSQETNRC